MNDHERITYMLTGRKPEPPPRWYDSLWFLLPAYFVLALAAVAGFEWFQGHWA